MRKQKLWKSVMAVFTCAALMLSEPFAYAAEQEVSAQEEIGSEFQIEDGVLVKYTGKAAEVKVPDGVTSIGDRAFDGCSSLSSIELPESLTGIGYSAFYSCSSLSSIELPEGVTSIGAYAFESCSSLSSIELPEGVTSIGYRAFAYCSSLTSINVASQNSEYASYDGCLYNKDLTRLICCPEGKSEVKLSDNLTSIGGYAFYGCSSLSSIELPESVTSIGDSAFCRCSSLSSIELPESVTSIGDSAFSGCSSLSSIELPEGVTSIGSHAFCDCSSLSSIELPESVTSIGDSAFLECSSLSSIRLPESVTSIEYRAFANCSSLTSINVASQNSEYASYDGCLYNKDLTRLICCPGGKSEVKLSDNLTSIVDSAFMDCSSLSSIELPEGVTSIGDHAFERCSSLSSIELPEGVTSIGWGAFVECSSLSSIELPEGVTSIGEYAFDGCSSLTSINVASQNSEYASYDGCLHSKDLTRLICCPDGKSEVKWSDNLTVIEDSAFSGCSNLSSIEVPEGVTSIGEYAFDGCSSLSSIELPEGVTSIGHDAFYGCSSLSSIKIPESITCISTGVFSRCRSLRSIKIPESVTSIENHAFYGCSSLSSIELPEGIASIDYRAFADCSSLSSIELPESVTSIGYDAFSGCSELLTIYCKEGSYAQQYAIDNEIKYELIKTPAVTEAAVTEEAAKAVSDAAVVTSKDGKEFDVELSITPVKDTGAADLVNADKALEAAKMKAFAVLDLTLTVNGKRVSLIDEKICVNIPMDKIFADITTDTVVSVYRIDNGQLSFLGTSKAAADKTITFATEHFSPYVFVPVEDARAFKDVKVVDYLGDIDPSASVDIKSADIGLKNNSDILFGDANSDGDVNSKDAVLIKKHLAGYTGLGIDLSAADVNADGKVDSKDAVKLLKKLAGYDVVLGEP